MVEEAEQPALQVIILVSVQPCSYLSNLLEEIRMRPEAPYVMVK